MFFLYEWTIVYYVSKCLEYFGIIFLAYQPLKNVYTIEIYNININMYINTLYYNIIYLLVFLNLNQLVMIPSISLRDAELFTQPMSCNIIIIHFRPSISLIIQVTIAHFFIFPLFRVIYDALKFACMNLPILFNWRIFIWNYITSCSTVITVWYLDLCLRDFSPLLSTNINLYIHISSRTVNIYLASYLLVWIYSSLLMSD